MTKESPPAPSRAMRVRRPRSANRQFAVGVSRAFGGAVLFSLPMLMTMEMWELGFVMDRMRLALLLVLAVPLLVGLSHFSGFEETFDFRQDALDAFVAYAVGFAAGAVVLLLFGVLRFDISLDEAVGKVALQALPASIGALLAHSQLGRKEDDDGGIDRKRPSGYGSQLFVMMIGALFLSFNVAPTEEMTLLAYMMSPWQVLALAALSLAAMHGFVYALEFTGQKDLPPGTPIWSAFVRFTIPGYAIALLISGYVLWSFGRLDATSAGEAVATILVLGFPAAIGAAAARLIL